MAHLPDISGAKQDRIQEGRRVSPLLLVLVLLGIIAALLSRIYSPDNLLLKRAARLITATKRGPIRWYAWISDQELLLWYDPPNAPFKSNLSRVWRYEVNTGRTNLMRRLDALVCNSPADPNLSPDGKGVFQHFHGSDGLLGSVSYMSMDGTRNFSQHCSVEEPYVEIRPLKDSRRWIELMSLAPSRIAASGGMTVNADQTVLNEIAVHTLDHPKRARIISIPLNSPLRFQDRNSSDDLVTPEDRLVTDNCDARRQTARQISKVKIVVSGPDLDVTRTQTYAVTPPSNTKLFAMVYSPHGEQIAWEVQTVRVSPFAAFLHRLWPSVKGYAQPAFQLWISRLDGTQMHEIGHMDGEFDNDGPLEQLQWSPDGKRLSFIYQDTLYTMPAN